MSGQVDRAQLSNAEELALGTCGRRLASYEDVVAELSWVLPPPGSARRSGRDPNPRYMAVSAVINPHVRMRQGIQKFRFGCIDRGLIRSKYKLHEPHLSTSPVCFHRY